MRLDQTVPVQPLKPRSIPLEPPSIIQELTQNKDTSETSTPEEKNIAHQNQALICIKKALDLCQMTATNARKLKDALYIARDELLASATREVLTAVRAQDIKETIAKRKDGTWRKVGG